MEKAFSFGFRGRALTETWLLLSFFACIFFLSSFGYQCHTCMKIPLYLRNVGGRQLSNCFFVLWEHVHVKVHVRVAQKGLSCALRASYMTILSTGISITYYFPVG